jgi:hypothetical protein
VVLCQQGIQFFGDRASADGVTVRTVSNVARGVK